MAHDIEFSDIDIKLKKDSVGNVKIVKNHEAVSQSVINILTTRRGERLMLPDFGSNIHGLLFQPIDPVTSTLLRLEIIEAIKKWDDRVEISEVEVTEQPDKNLYEINIYYYLADTEEDGTLSLTLKQ